MPWPNFLIIGAAKSGTTSLYHYLAEHPQIFMSKVKETNFFAYPRDGRPTYVWGDEIKRSRFTVTTEADYLALFDAVRGEKAVGEASPVYLGSTIAPSAIRRRLPDARLVVILRNPVERAYSGYQMHVRGLATRLPASKAFDADRHWVRQGMYFSMLSRYFELFSRGQIEVLLFDDLKADAARLMRGLYRSLGVDDGFLPSLEKAHNPGGLPRSTALAAIKKLLRPVARRLPHGLRQAGLAFYNATSTRKAPGMSAEARRQLEVLYRDDVERLSELVGMELSSRWLPRP